jgi:hypothetical protein
MTDTPITLHLSPNGLWRRQRFEFCNALEVVTGLQANDELRAIMWAELERLGVQRVSDGREPTETTGQTGK